MAVDMLVFWYNPENMQKFLSGKSWVSHAKRMQKFKCQMNIKKFLIRSFDTGGSINY
jgi:hypothetical protein